MAKQLFFVTALTNAAAVKEKVETVVAEKERRYELAPDKWVVYTDGPAGELASKLGIRDDPHVGTGLVLTLGSYGGRAPSSLWEWIKAQTE
ncbi:conserved hypothetical protein [Paraburkholderia piptadeniae]|uniref:Uncharacterized protein n=1 Tax=Paraburkholderia piptadeniae TaxID=1701573 RepID=A0A1N7S8Q1_9BURK|nr:hypothetical protein [Paraburkholderia piptadeniae]SIT43776.1 conserved hypothetical protein [Paraburkholderia piptadeniae]